MRAGLDYLAAEFRNQPTTLCGFSFGARVGLEVGISDDRVRNLISIGTPIDKYDFSFLDAVRKPLLMIHGDRDEFGDVKRVMALAARLKEEANVEVHVIKDSDHFFEGHLDELKQIITDWTNRQLAN